MSNLIAGLMVNRFGGRAVVGGALALLVVLFAILPALATCYRTAIAAVVLYGMIGFSVTTPQTHQLVNTEPANAALVVALGGAVLYLSIALSGVLGGVAIDMLGQVNFVYVAAAVMVVVVLLSELAYRLGRV
ncbi:hypothetical protein [Saccharopolyspora sp. NPDC050642]|uniref:hypothetical protein n=1 Tax=Saccharopolyspora sp. NPDC050642 TaxID=3157099 RepID=UPI0033CB4DD0